MTDRKPIHNICDGVASLGARDKRPWDGTAASDSTRRTITLGRVMQRHGCVGSTG